MGDSKMLKIYPVLLLLNSHEVHVTTRGHDYFGAKDKCEEQTQPGGLN